MVWQAISLCTTRQMAYACAVHLALANGEKPIDNKSNAGSIAVVTMPLDTEKGFSMGQKLIELSLPIGDPNDGLDTCHLARTLQKVCGVASVFIDPAAQQAQVTFDPSQVDTFTLVTAVATAGYHVPTETLSLPIGNMTCAACAFHVESALTDIPGVISAEVDLVSGQATVTFMPGVVQPGNWRQALAEVGYQVLA